MIIENAISLIGQTPMLKAHSLAQPGGATIYVKLEKFNLTGSVKDRPLLEMLTQMKASGELVEGDTLVEATSGNTGIALAAVASLLGFRSICVMPDSMSQERRALITAYGGELLLTEAALGMKGAIAKAQEICLKPHHKLIGQFDNHHNPTAHYNTTAAEIMDDLPQVDALICGVGTGGSVTGLGRRLKEFNPAIKIIAVEPMESAVLAGNPAGKHGIQGIGAGFIPSIYDPKVIDRIEAISTQESYAMARQFARDESVLVGISTGAAIAVALRLAQELGEGKNIVVIAPDGGEKYISMNLYASE